MQLNMDGFLGAVDSALEVKFRADDLLDWNDFINTIRGPDNPAPRIAGKATWNGRVLGPLVGPTFAGHVHSTKYAYDKLYWDEIDGDMEYSPDGFQLAKATVRRGGTTADLDLSLQFDGDWNFLPCESWTLTAQLEHAPSDDLQIHVRHVLSAERLLQRQRPRRRHARRARVRFEFHLRRY